MVRSAPSLTIHQAISSTSNSLCHWVVVRVTYVRDLYGIDANNASFSYDVCQSRKNWVHNLMYYSPMFESIDLNLSVSNEINLNWASSKLNNRCLSLCQTSRNFRVCFASDFFAWWDGCFLCWSSLLLKDDVLMRHWSIKIFVSTLLIMDAKCASWSLILDFITSMKKKSHQWVDLPWLSLTWYQHCLGFTCIYTNKYLCSTLPETDLLLTEWEEVWVGPHIRYFWAWADRIWFRISRCVLGFRLRKLPKCIGITPWGVPRDTYISNSCVL